MTAFLDKDIADYLTGGGFSLDAYSLIGEAGEDLPCFWSTELGFRYVVIESNDLARAAVDFLARRGARRFRNETELFRAAHAEGWPGWEQHAP